MWRQRLQQWGQRRQQSATAAPMPEADAATTPRYRQRKRFEPSLNRIHRKPLETPPTTWLGRYSFGVVDAFFHGKRHRTCLRTSPSCTSRRLLHLDSGSSPSASDEMPSASTLIFSWRDGTTGKEVGEKLCEMFFRPGRDRRSSTGHLNSLSVSATAEAALEWHGLVPHETTRQTKALHGIGNKRAAYVCPTTRTTFNCEGTPNHRRGMAGKTRCPCPKQQGVLLRSQILASDGNDTNNNNGGWCVPP